MYDVTWIIDDMEHMVRYEDEDEDEAKKHYDELVDSKKCEWVQMVHLLANWSIND